MSGILEELRPLGFTPLASRIKREVLKYNFEGVGPIVMDKSGHGNLGRLKPKDDPPKRKIVSWFPLKMIMAFDGENDHVKSTSSNLGKYDNNSGTVSLRYKADTLQNSRILVIDDSKIEIRHRGVEGNELQVRWAGATGMPSVGEYTSFYSAPVGNWHDIVFTWDDGHYWYYIDNQLKQDMDFSPSSVPSNPDIYIGCSPRLSKHFKGEIDYIRTYGTHTKP